MPPSSLEQAEKLEQLRMLQSGGTILVGVVDHAASGIDTPADYAAFVARQPRAAAMRTAECDCDSATLRTARSATMPS